MENRGDRNKGTPAKELDYCARVALFVTTISLWSVPVLHAHADHRRPPRIRRAPPLGRLLAMSAGPGSDSSLGRS
jgi:hypothetical protein